MIIKFLHWKRAAFSVLFTLLLSVAGVTNAFAQTFTMGNLNYSINSDGATVTVTGHVDGTNATGELVIPESVELYGTTYPVTVIGNSAFSNCYGLTGSLVIPNSVTTIGSNAFYYCNGFNGSLTLGNAVQTIDSYAFRNCYGLTGTLTIPENVTGIGYQSFRNCGFTSLNYNATNCSYVDNTWLNNTSSLTTVNIGENVQVIPSYFLTNYTTFTGDLVIPESVTLIGDDAFYGCTGFNGSLTIGNSVASIGGYAFYGCTGFNGSLVIPESVTSIGNNAFNGCSGFSGSLAIGNSVTSIGENAFNGCTGFTGSLTIPNSVSSIGVNAFSGCTGFSGTLTLGGLVTEIGNTAFFGACQGFTSFVLLPEVPPTLGNNVFISADYSIPVSVPCGSLEAYQEAEGWNVFTNLQEFNPCLWVITANANPTSCGTVSGTGTYEQGNTCTLVANPNENFSFVNWTEDGVVVSTDAEYAFTVTENRHLMANFIIDNLIGEGTATHSYLPSYSYYPYSLTQQIYTAEEIGQMGVINWVAFYNAGSQKTRNFDFYLVHTEKSSFSSSNDWVAVTNADKVFSGNVNMVSSDWTIIYFDTPFAYNGTSNVILVVDDNTGNWNSGLACRVFETSGNQAIFGYSDTNFDPINPTLYNGSRPTVKNQIALGFSSLSCAVFASVSPEGAGSVSGEGAYQLGETCTLTAIPSSNDYVFVNWTENGEVVSTNAQYSFTVTSNRNVVANFLQFRVDITASANPEEGGTVSGGGSYLLGQTCTLTATANESYVFVNWMENGQEVSTNANYSFTVTGSRTLVARFVDPVGTVQALYYPDNMNPESPYVKVVWSGFPSNVMVGDETSTNSTSFMPYHALYNYSISEALFTAAELTQAGVTTGQMISLSWEAIEVTTTQSQNNISIWMANVPDTQLTTTSHLASNMTLVYTGNVGVPPLGWNEFVFNEDDFAWDGHSNVLILCQRNNGQWQGSVKWRSHSPGFNGMTYKYQDNTPYDAMNQTYAVTCINNRPNTMFKCTGFENSNYYYKVYRKDCDSNNYSLIADNVSGLMYTDSLWLQLPLGSYQYGVSVIKDDGSETIVASSCIDRNLYTYQITTTVNYEGRGTVSGAGEYALGATCTLTATTIGNNTFTCWKENGTEVSTEANYSFTVTGPRSLVAVFSVSPDDIIVFADNNVKAICVNNWDADGDGELAHDEASAVTDLGSVFRYNSGISSFNELQYFTGLTSIGYRAFYNCYYLNSITLPNTVTSIGQQAFYNCYYLNSFTLPNSLVSIGSYAFYNCSSLSGSLVVPNSVTNIDSYAFSYCSGLTSVSLPSGMSYINGGVFYNCYNLSSISLPTSLYSIGSSAFYNCSALSSLTMPNSVTYIYDNAFEGCVSLASVGFSTSLYSIGYRAFYGCSGLTGTLELPNSVSLIGEEAFMDCTSITGLNLPTYLSSIGSSAFRNCSGIRGEITLPASLWSVGGYAFYGCDGFSTVNYNATNCSSFGSASNPVFYDCAFPHLNIGANVQRIPDNAFKRCFMITDMNVAAANPPTVYSSTFGMVPRSIPVTVPFGSGDAYRSAQYWEEFFNIIEDNGTVYTNYWQPNGSQYANNMSVIGIIQIDGVEQSTNALEIGAFCGDECRGSQLLTYYPQLNRYLVFFTLYGEEGDILFFRLYDHELDQESDLGCASYITFESNGILGTYSSPYVFNFAHIQNTMLDAGWTWFSSYVELNGLDGLSMMEESLGSNGLMIKSQSDGYASYSNTIGQWSGSLSSVNNEQMYMINISAPCVLNMTGSYAVPTQHPIVLSPGWTWIGYPLTSATSINEALSGLNAQDGDVIKSKSSFSTYIEGVGWTGWLNTFNPSFGMMYYSQKNGPISFVYANGAKSGALLENLATESIHYEPERTAYPYNMTVIAVVELDGEELESETSELAVFANGECRGSAKLLYVEPLHRYLAFLTVSGKDDAELRFRLYNTETGEEYYDAEVNLNFRDNAMIGDTRNPFVVRFRSKTDLDECVNSVKLYPNPVASGECFHIGMNADLNAPIRVEIINALGVEVSCATTVQSPVTLNAPKAAGVYTLRITTEGKGSIVRKLMVR